MDTVKMYDEFGEYVRYDPSLGWKFDAANGDNSIDFSYLRGEQDHILLEFNIDSTKPLVD